MKKDMKFISENYFIFKEISKKVTKNLQNDYTCLIYNIKIKIL